VLRAASFSYPGTAEPAFRDVDLEITAGSFVAVTGPVGAGKSALARCLAGVYRPDSGEIWLGDRHAAEVTPGLVGYAPQDGYIFSGSLRENVLLEAGQEATTSNGAVDSLIELAGLTADVAALPRGVETEVGELGVRISGGQRQRLGLARAAAARMPGVPGLLVLDDPFSAVDVDTEAQIVASLLATFGPSAPPERRATIVLFSHRLAAFAPADLVVVLDQGRIVECGRHDDLLQALVIVELWQRQSF
jgi:ABC-type bacteriocin/lantibiotic exporter with double-glycine peptidase domain